MTNQNPTSALNRLEIANREYRQLRDETARLSLRAIADETRELFPNARWVGLDTGDQDASGYQWVIAIFSENSVLASNDNDAEELDVMSEVASNLDDSTRGIWFPFAIEHVEFAHGIRAECFLDIDKIIAEID